MSKELNEVQVVFERESIDLWHLIPRERESGCRAPTDARVQEAAEFLTSTCVPKKDNRVVPSRTREARKRHQECPRRRESCKTRAPRVCSHLDQNMARKQKKRQDTFSETKSVWANKTALFKTRRANKKLPDTHPDTLERIWILRRLL